jgi:hypothetical protein
MLDTYVRVTVHNSAVSHKQILCGRMCASAEGGSGNSSAQYRQLVSYAHTYIYLAAYQQNCVLY